MVLDRMRIYRHRCSQQERLTDMDQKLRNKMLARMSEVRTQVAERDDLIEVISTKVSITVCALYLEYAITKFKN